MRPRRQTPTRCTNLKVAIALRHHTQREIAAATQIAETRLSDFICGRATPTKDEMRRLAQELRFSIRQLFGEADLVAGERRTA